MTSVIETIPIDHQRRETGNVCYLREIQYREEDTHYQASDEE